MWDESTEYCEQCGGQKTRGYESGDEVAQVNGERNLTMPGVATARAQWYFRDAGRQHLHVDEHRGTRHEAGDVGGTEHRDWDSHAPAADAMTAHWWRI